MTDKKLHISVLQNEVIDALAIKNSSIVVDATFGAGGHAKLITTILKKAGVFIGIDADSDAIAQGENILGDATCQKHLVTGNFRNIESILDLLHIDEVDAIFADLGWRMEQFSGNGRGFSFMIDEPLIMTFGDPEKYSFTAKDIVNDWDELDIKNVLKAYGEERFSGRIARNIVETRRLKPIDTTFELVEVITKAVPVFYTRGKIHPATRTFQALRITVNDEFDALQDFIKSALVKLKPQGRLVIITFHSLEDRIVKHLFKSLAHDQCGSVVTKKPIVATRDELRMNPRARSAKMRIFEKNETI